MFDRFRHEKKPSLCLDSMTWDGNYLECEKCKSVIATLFSGELKVMDRYATYDDKIFAYVRAFPNPGYIENQSDEWDCVKDKIRDIRREANSVRKSNEQRRIDHPDWFDEDGDPIELDDVYDDEDSAAGDAYLGDDEQSEEGEDE
jgi:hypothetical protein